MNSSLLTLLALLLGGGGSDLLAYVPTEAFWKSRHVLIPVSLETMTQELRPATERDVTDWIDDLDSPDSLVRGRAYHRLLAAGQMALTPLQKAAVSEDKQIARRAKALIAEAAG